MIIKSLKINNIYSLQGHHTINFDKMQKYSSLLAITGKTGAGKSTILNCISLALFGKTHIKSLTKEDYLTLGEKKGSIELIFTIKGGEYKVNWSVTAKGSLSRKITHNDEIITQRINESIVEVIKLNFDQFNKTIILNQGEFANFISSSFAQRKDILEELTDVQNLKKLSQVVKLQIKQLEQEFSQLENSLSASTILSDKEEKELQEQLHILKKDIVISQQKEKDLKIILTTYETIHDNSKRFLKNQQSIKKCDSEVREITTKQNDLKKELDILNEKLTNQTIEFNKILPKIKRAQELEQQSTAQKNKQSFILHEQEGLDIDLKKHEKNCEDTHSLLRENQYKLDQFSRKLAILNKITPPNSLSEVRSSIRDISLSEQNINNINDQILHNNKESEVILRKREDLTQRLEDLCTKHKISDIGQINSQIKEIKIAIKVSEQQLEDKQVINAKYGDSRKQQLKLESTLTENMNSVLKISQEILVLEKELNIEKLAKVETEKLIALQELDKAISLLKHENTKHDSCLVCNSKLESVDNHSTITISNVQGLVEKKKDHDDKIQKSSLSIEKKQLAIISLNNEQKSIKNELHQLDIFLNDNNCATLNQDILTIKAQLNQFSNSINDLFSSEKEGLLLAEQLKEIKIKYSQLNEQIKQHEDLLVSNINRENVTWKHIASLLQLDEIDIKQIPISKLEQYCDLLSSHAQLSKELKSAKEQQQKAQQQSKHLKSETQKITNLLIENSTMITKLIGQNTSSEFLHKEWEEELAHLKTTTVEKKSELDSLEFQRRELQGRLDTHHLQVNLIQQDSLNELAKVSQKNFSTNNEVINKAISFKEKIALMIATPSEDSLKEFMFFIEDLIQKPLETIQFELDQLKRQQAKISERLTVHEEQQTRQQIMIKRSCSIKAKLKPKKELFQIIGNDEFRNYLLTLIEKQLLSQSNIELQSLCSGRYKIIQRNSEFYIIDGNLQGQLRKISTLSGGEKFMVSLAMALGLAEMTKGAAKVDSFFIDEGFGTLDSEALDELLDVLNEVQARGKSITIITHLKELYRRIPVNLHINKQNDGRSTIKTVFN